MNLQNDVRTLLQKKMDRREFIKHVGVGFAAIIGVTTLLRTMSSLGGGQKQTNGYGASVYGGSKSSQAVSVRQS
jgi:hypothetical protein